MGNVDVGGEMPTEDFYLRASKSDEGRAKIHDKAW